jgi:hypothetical protein
MPLVAFDFHFVDILRHGAITDEAWYQVGADTLEQVDLGLKHSNLPLRHFLVPKPLPNHIQVAVIDKAVYRPLWQNYHTHVIISILNT